MGRIIDGIRFLSIREAAKRLDIDPRTLKKQIKQNTCDLEYSIDPLTGKVYFKEEVVEQIVKKFVKGHKD